MHCRSPPERVPTGWSRIAQCRFPSCAISSRVTFAATVAVEERDRSPAAHRLAAKEEIPRNGHQRDHRQILEHGRDAAIERVARAVERDRLAIDQKLALGRLVNARQDLDQGRLAGAIVAEQAMNFARPDRRRKRRKAR